MTLHSFTEDKWFSLQSFFKPLCYVCNEEVFFTDVVCSECKRHVCIECTVPYIQHNLIDYTLCKKCYGLRSEHS